jgi:hypothetical protein
MNGLATSEAKILAEILQLHRWAGGSAVSLETIYGLANGVESIIAEIRPKTISTKTQEAVEDVLQDVESGKQSSDGMAIKDRLQSDQINEHDASVIMRLCILQSRFGDGVEKIAKGQGSPFPSLLRSPSPVTDWAGALH